MDPSPASYNADPISRLAHASENGVQLSDRERRHCLVWNEVFKDGVLLRLALKHGVNSFLLGQGAKNLYYAKKCSEWLGDEPRTTCLAFVSLDRTGKLRDAIEAEGLLNEFEEGTRDEKLAEFLRKKCLHPHSWDPDRCEATIRNDNGSIIIVNIYEWVRHDLSETLVWDLSERLLEFRGDEYHTRALFLRDLNDSNPDRASDLRRLIKGAPWDGNELWLHYSEKEKWIFRSDPRYKSDYDSSDDDMDDDSDDDSDPASSTLTSKAVFVDIPDTDNVLMVLQVLRDFPDDRVAVVLSPRPVDFKVRRYGKVFKSIMDKVGIKKMITPLEGHPAWVDELDEDLKDWFSPDADLSDPDARDDTCLYMQVSALRFAAVLESAGVAPGRYTFYWDTSSMDKIRAGMRHAFHVHDFTYGFDEAEQQRYDADTAADTPGDTYREQLRGICTDYVRRMARHFGLEKPEAILNSFADLLQANKQANKKALLVVGGPFTEPLEYVRQAPVDEVVAMAGFIDGGRNIFPNQFNFHVDMASAKAFLACVAEQGIPLKLVPTECVKGSIFELNDAELQSVFSDSPGLYELAMRYCKDAGTPGSYKLFDWVAALLVKNPSLLPTKRVKTSVERVEGTEIIKFEPHLEGRIQMCWPDEEYMAARKTKLLEKMTC